MSNRLGPLVFVALVSIAPAAAAEPTDAAKRSLEVFEQSMIAYRAGRFDETVELLLRARALYPEPVLLYNLGRVYEAQGRPRQAADAYAQYLAEESHAPDRAAIEARIGTLRAQARELEKAHAPPTGAEGKGAWIAVTPPRRASLAPAAAVTGVGVAGLLSGVVLAMLAQARHERAAGEPVQRVAVEGQARAEDLATAGRVTLIAGGVVAGLGAVWLGLTALSRRGEPTTAGAGPWLLGGRF